MQKKPNSPLPVLFESIRLADGRLPLLAYHQRRMDLARRALFKKSPVLKLEQILAETELPTTGVHKVRLEYDTAVRRIDVTPYTPRSVTSLRLVAADDVRYGRKFADRSGIQRCYARRGDADDVIMVQRGYLTDASYANLALHDGTHWYTPAWPLLGGTRRQQLVEGGVLRPVLIRERDLGNFQQIRLMNAMLEWEEGPEVRIEDVEG